MYRIFRLCMLFALSAATAQSQSVPSDEDLTPRFQARGFRTAGGTAVPYRLHVPKQYDPDRRYPLILWFHGGAARGDDNRSQIGLGNVDALGVLSADSIQLEYPTFILAPQVPLGGMWAGSQSDSLSTTAAAALEIIQQLVTEFSIDRQRLYLMGHSLGGHGTWDILAKRPGIFAAGVPIMGRGDTTLVRQRPAAAIWAFAGVLDQTVPIEHTRAVVRAFKRVGADLRYTEYADGAHDVTPRIFLEPGFLAWLFGQRLAVE